MTPTDPVPASVSPHVVERRIELPGAGAVFVRECLPGEATGGVPILMLHDSLGSVALWRDFPDRLSAATGRRVIAYDRPGFGRSAPRHAPPSLDFIAAEARDVIEPLCAALGVDRFVVFGHSVGGGMAVHCAARHRDRCVGLITVAAQAFVEERTRAGLREAQALFADPVQLERLARYHGDKARWVLDAWIETWLDPAFAHWSLDAVLPQVCCPLLAIHGADDEYGSPAHPERIARLSGGPAQIAVMADTRHMPHREHPDAVLAAVADFCAALG